MAKLKVYRTPIGFHDAYVAAPSQKAALAAWGADANLFVRGQAEQVDDPALMKAPLASPGEVIKVVRGTTAEHLGALPADDAPRTKRKGGESAKPAKPVAKAPPRPRRTALDAAEAALETLDRDHRAALAELRREEAALAERRRKAEAAHAREQERLTAKADTLRRDWRQAMDRWRDAQ